MIKPAGKKSPKDVRVAAALAVADVLQDGQSLSAVIPFYSSGLAERDRGLLQELCFGCLRYLPALNLLLQELVTKPLKGKDGDIHALILLGLYQLDYTRIPDHAAISATVEASKLLSKEWAANFINGVLRNYLREKPRLVEKFAKNPNFLYAHPQWLLDKLRAAWPEHWRELLAANNGHPPFTLRVNQLRIKREDYLQCLTDAGIAAQATQFSSTGVTLEQALSVNLLPNFADGFCSVQDEAAQLAANLLQLSPGHRVLDACCAPGGKSCHILEVQPAIEHLLAVDISASRMPRVEENLRRLGLMADLKVADLTEPDTWWDGKKFDRILLDAPCSATGVIRRHPDIKTLRRASDISQLAKLQLKILTQLWPCLSPGGRLVYATCSLLPDENTKVVAQFMAIAEDAIHVPINAEWGVEQPFGRQLLPQLAGHDGFYYAVLEKNVQ